MRTVIRNINVKVELSKHFTTQIINKSIKQNAV